MRNDVLDNIRSTWLGRDVVFYMAILIMPIGILFNFAACIVFIRKPLNQNTQRGFICFMLGLFNIVVLSTQLANFLTAAFDNPWYDLSQFSCKFVNLLLNVTLQLPSFQQCLITAETLLCVKYPSKFRSLRTRKAICLIMCILVVILVILNVEAFFYALHEEKIFNDASNRTEISTECALSLRLSLILDIMNILMRNLVPFIVILVMNRMIVYHVRSSRRRVFAGSISKRFGGVSASKRDVNFVNSITAMNILFFVIYFAWTVALLCNQVYANFFATDNQNSERIKKALDYFLIASEFVSYMHNSSLFFIGLAFNSQFRKELNTILASFGVVRKENSSISAAATDLDITDLNEWFKSKLRKIL